MTTFVLSDESMNDYGTWVKTSGIDISQFVSNPVMLLQHDRWRYLPIGKWDNIRIEGDRLLADAVFDTQDPTAQAVASKVEQGIMRAASVGLDILELSDAPEMIKVGQRRQTITRSRLFEASIVDIPANPNALKLSAPKVSRNQITLAAGTADATAIESFIPPIMDLKKISLALGLADNATEEQVMAAINSLREEQTAALLAAGKAAGLVTTNNEAAFRSLALTNPQALRDLIGTQPKPEQGKAATIREVLKAAAGTEQSQPVDVKASWTIRDWEKKDPAGLLVMKHNEAERYQKLFNDFYN